MTMGSRLDTASRASLEARVRRLRPDSVRQWGRMTPHQAICHMSDAFRMSLNERQAAPVGKQYASGSVGAAGAHNAERRMWFMARTFKEETLQ